MICSSGIGFDPHIDGQRLTFGFEGAWQGTAVLYDHQTGSLWLHLLGECIRGPYEGKVLTPLPSGRHTTWGDWLATHPDTSVLAEDPALAARPGTRRAYFTREGSRSGHPYLPPGFFETILEHDERVAAHALVYGVVLGDEARAFPFFRLRLKPVVEESVGGVAITVWFDAASRSAAAFRRELDGQRLSFRPLSKGIFRDTETESHWNMEGLCVSGRRRGAQLTRLHGLMSEWYGWYASHPQTTLHE